MGDTTVRLAKQSTSVQAVPPPRADLHGLRVLIVDDSATNRTILRHYLTAWGMHSESAEDGAQGLELLCTAATGREPYKLAILDFWMPGMGGLELTRAIKAKTSMRTCARRPSCVSWRRKKARRRDRLR